MNGDEPEFTKTSFRLRLTSLAIVLKSCKRTKRYIIVFLLFVSPWLNFVSTRLMMNIVWIYWNHRLNPDLDHDFFSRGLKFNYIFGPWCFNRLSIIIKLTFFLKFSTNVSFSQSQVFLWSQSVRLDPTVHLLPNVPKKWKYKHVWKYYHEKDNLKRTSLPGYLRNLIQVLIWYVLITTYDIILIACHLSN